MGHLDAAQFAHRRRIHVGSFEVPVTNPTKGVAAIKGTAWYIRVVQKVRIRIEIIKTKDHRGVSVGINITSPFPDGGDSEKVKTHLRAVVRKYYRKFREGDWPVSKNYLLQCNSPWRDGFVESTCSDCSARYCTVER
tara:strand:- start:880 stop:1290 length:411 start_codon:yes stop_codon:yes gene_type:complete